jgi:hypothetical protein
VKLLRTFWVGILWLLFVALWYRVYGITTIVDVSNAITYLVVTVSLYGIVVTVWVMHNISIYRKKGARKGVRVLSYAAIHDHLGSYIVAKTDLTQKQSITINVANGRKIFSEGAKSVVEGL